MKNIILIVAVLFSVAVLGQDLKNCDCTVETYDLIELDSILREEQMNILNIQKAIANGFKLPKTLDCSKRKLKAIEQRIKRVKQFKKT